MNIHEIIGISDERGYNIKNNVPKTVCGGWDSNPRTPARPGPQPGAFDRAWLPPLLCHNKEVVHLKECYVL